MFLPSFPRFPTEKEKLDYQWPASLQRVPLVNLTAHVPYLPPSETGNVPPSPGGRTVSSSCLTPMVALGGK